MQRRSSTTEGRGRAAARGRVQSVQDGIRAVAASYHGRLLLGVTIGVSLLALTTLGLRFTGAAGGQSSRVVAPTAVPADYPRLDRPAPALDLFDQRGLKFALEQLRGRVVLVTFAYAHCQTVCPVVVADVLQACHLLSDLHPTPAVVVVTLDPWRDTPLRLSALAARWGLEANAFVLGGSVSAVEAALAQWGVPATRDERTGEITHAAVVYIVDRNGRIGFAVNGDASAIAALARQL